MEMIENINKSPIFELRLTHNSTDADSETKKKREPNGASPSVNHEHRLCVGRRDSLPLFNQSSQIMRPTSDDRPLYLKNYPPKREQPTIKDPDRKCTICGKDYKAVAPLQKTCSKECRKKKCDAARIKFHADNDNKHKEYNENRLKKNPSSWVIKSRQERLEIIKALGGGCLACGHDNPLHLHIDYKPTMVGTGYRHPRHKNWVMAHLSDFRLLCANHHYELTITGRIEGTNITQKCITRKNLKPLQMRLAI